MKKTHPLNYIIFLVSLMFSHTSHALSFLSFIRALDLKDPCISVSIRFVCTLFYA